MDTQAFAFLEWGQGLADHALLQSMPVAVCTTDETGRITFYNQAAAELWGYSPVLGQDRWCGSWRLYMPDGTPLPHHQCAMAITLKENRPVRDCEAVAERPCTMIARFPGCGLRMVRDSTERVVPVLVWN